MTLAHVTIASLMLALAGGAFGEVRAQTELSESQIQDHTRALELFKKGCIELAPDFETSAEVFRTGRLDLTNNGFWIDTDEILRAAVNRDSNKCVVGLDNASADYFVEALRGVMTKEWIGQNFREIPRNTDFPAHLFVRLDQELLKQFTVAVNPLKDLRTVLLEFIVSDPFTSQ